MIYSSIMLRKYMKQERTEWRGLLKWSNISFLLIYIFISRPKVAFMTFKGIFPSFLKKIKFIEGMKSILSGQHVSFVNHAIFILLQGQDRWTYLLPQWNVRQFKCSCTLLPNFVSPFNVGIPFPNKKPTNQRNCKERTSINLHILSFDLLRQ